MRATVWPTLVWSPTLTLSASTISRNLRAQVMLHLHRLDDDENIARLNRRPDRGGDARHTAGKRRENGAVGDARPSRQRVGLFEAPGPSCGGCDQHAFGVHERRLHDPAVDLAAHGNEGRRVRLRLEPLDAVSARLARKSERDVDAALAPAQFRHDRIAAELERHARRRPGRQPGLARSEAEASEHDGENIGFDGRRRGFREAFRDEAGMGFPGAKRAVAQAIDQKGLVGRRPQQRRVFERTGELADRLVAIAAMRDHLGHH